MSTDTRVMQAPGRRALWWVGLVLVVGCIAAGFCAIGIMVGSALAGQAEAVQWVLVILAAVLGISGRIVMARAR